MNLAARLRSDLKTAASFHRAGATLGSLILYPFRRRANLQTQITLKNGFTIRAPREAELTALFQDIWVERSYAPHPFSLGSEDTVVDLGAQVGVFTLWAAAQFPRVPIIAVEPSPESFAILQQNVTRNRLNQVELLEAAAGGRSGMGVLHSRGSISMHTLYRRDLLHSTFLPVASVPMITLDDLFERFHIVRCGLLKLDCEGAEYETLMNASNAVLGRIHRITMEYHRGLNDGTPEQLSSFLESRGFNVTVSAPRSSENGYLYAMLRN
jgi:FkbM family methyltransferase